MQKFELILLDGLPPDRQMDFYKLSVDGKCPFDDFWAEINKGGNLSGDLEKVQTIISFITRGQKVHHSWFDELKHRPKGDNYKDFEIRGGRLRVYLFEDVEEGKIIVAGEVKKDSKGQQREIDKMRKLKIAYFFSKG